MEGLKATDHVIFGIVFFICLLLLWWKIVANGVANVREARMITRLRQRGVIVPGTLTKRPVSRTARPTKVHMVTFTYFIEGERYQGAQILSNDACKVISQRRTPIHIRYLPEEKRCARIDVVYQDTPQRLDRQITSIVLLLASCQFFFGTLTAWYWIPQDLGTILALVSCGGFFFLLAFGMFAAGIYAVRQGQKGKAL